MDTVGAFVFRASAPVFTGTTPFFIFWLLKTCFYYFNASVAVRLGLKTFEDSSSPQSNFSVPLLGVLLGILHFLGISSLCFSSSKDIWYHLYTNDLCLYWTSNQGILSENPIFKRKIRKLLTIGSLKTWSQQPGQLLLKTKTWGDERALSMNSEEAKWSNDACDKWFYNKLHGLTCWFYV